MRVSEAEGGRIPRLGRQEEGEPSRELGEKEEEGEEEEEREEREAQMRSGTGQVGGMMTRWEACSREEATDPVPTEGEGEEGDSRGSPTEVSRGRGRRVGTGSLVLL